MPLLTADLLHLNSSRAAVVIIFQRFDRARKAVVELADAAAVHQLTC